MTNKVFVSVYLAATQRTYDFRVPYTLAVGQAADLMASLLEARERPRYSAPMQAGLMWLEGANTGAMVDPNELVGALALSEELVDGLLLALV